MIRFGFLQLCCLLVTLLTTVMSSQALAQQGTRWRAGQTTPASPYDQRLSPYLDLLRSDNSVLSPYHSFVQPRRQLRQSLQIQAAQIQRLQSVTAPRVPQTGASTRSRLPTGRGGTFQSYLHFYSFEPSNPRR